MHDHTRRSSYVHGVQMSLLLTQLSACAIQPIGSIRIITSPDAASQASSAIAVTSAPLLPAGAVVGIEAGSCPSGWSDFSDGRGRIIFGAGFGNSDADGLPLTTRAKGAVGGLEYTTGIPVSSAVGTHPAPASGAWSLGSFLNLYQLNFSMGSSFSGSLTEGNLPPYQVLRFCRKDQELAQIPSTASLFANVSCPLQWSLHSDSVGRVQLGQGSGNLDALSQPLTSRTLGSVGGLEYTSGIPGSNNGGNTSIPTSNYLASGETIYVEADPASQIWLGGAKANSNMAPFIALNVCRPVSSSKGVFTHAVAAFDLNSCPSGWSAFTPAQGRMVVGAGIGNNDSAGAPLSNRILGSTGGREYTTGFPVSPTADTDSPCTTCDLASDGLSIFVNAAPDTTLAGPASDSNMPPYIALLYCKKD